MLDTTLLSPDELADYLAIPVKTVYNWRTSGKGPRGVRIGRHLRFRWSDVQEWLDDNADPAEEGVLTTGRRRSR